MGEIRAQSKNNTNDAPRWLRAMAAATAINAIETINAALRPDASGAERFEALAACLWILNPNDDPLDFRAVCNLLGRTPDQGFLFHVQGLREFLRQRLEESKKPIAIKAAKPKPPKPQKPPSPPRPRRERQEDSKAKGKRIRLLEAVAWAEARPKNFDLAEAVRMLGLDAGDVQAEARALLGG